jgi:cell division protein FtsW
MLVLILILLALGTVAVFSASYPAALADPKISSPLFYIKKQIMFAGIGVAVMILTSLLPPAFYKKWSPAFFGITVLLLIAVPVIGIDYQGTKRWIGVPGTSFTAQPSEIMKFAIVLMLAWYLDKYRERVTDRLHLKNTLVYGVLIPGSFVAVSCGLVILEKHLSATAIIAAIGITVMLIGGSHVGITLGGMGVAGGGAFGLYLLKNPYALKRVSSKLDEDANVLAERWQTTQGLYAIGNGGPFGVGLGSSIQKYSYVSEAHTDFIFTIWCEETGYVGAVAVILLFLIFIWRGFKIAMHAPDTFSALTVYGLTAHVGIQAFLNMLVVTDNMFNTGVSLPFFSYGGSSLIFLMVEMGIILSISKHSFQKQ